MGGYKRRTNAGKKDGERGRGKGGHEKEKEGKGKNAVLISRARQWQPGEGV